MYTIKIRLFYLFEFMKIFSEINKNPHHLKLRNKQGALVLPDIFETYVWT